MEINQVNTNKSFCLCRNSIKLEILEIVIIFSEEKPLIYDKLVEIIFNKIKNENSNIVIDDMFLKTYVISLISELINSKLLKEHILSNEQLFNELYYLNFDGSKYLKKSVTFEFNDENSLNMINCKLVDAFQNLGKREDNMKGEMNVKIIEKTHLETDGKTLGVMGGKTEGKTERGTNDKTNNIVINITNNKRNDKTNDKTDNILYDKTHNKTNNKMDEKDLIYKNQLIDKINTLKIKYDKIKKDEKMKKLYTEIHRFNEIKDIGQELLGYIANNKGKRVKELYDELNISDDDIKK